MFEGGQISAIALNDRDLILAIDLANIMGIIGQCKDGDDKRKKLDQKID